MCNDINIPPPIRFNAFKHHRNYILAVLNSTSSQELFHWLDPLCNNYIDIYTGQMTPEEISDSILQKLQNDNLFEFENFRHWLAKGNGHRSIRLKDGSTWIIREGTDPERYIHVHPSRSGHYTIRFKGSTLKTIYQLKVGKKKTVHSPSLVQVNQTRQKIGLSPVKKLVKGKGILKCYHQFLPTPK